MAARELAIRRHEKLRRGSNGFEGKLLVGKGRLEGILCARAFKCGNAGVTVVEEKGSDKFVHLFIQFLFRLSSSQQEVEYTLPQGAHVVVDSAYILEKGIAVTVQNPSFLHIVSYYPAYDKETDFTKLRELGNVQFKARNFHGAIDLYTKSLAAASSGDNNKEAVVSGYSNRAAAWLKLGDNLKALEDSDEALKLNARHVKCLFRKAKALRNLHHYEASYQCLVEAAATDPSELGDELKEGLRLMYESLHGSHDLASYYIDRAVNGVQQQVPEFANFVGPMEVKMTPDGRGRGLFVTRNVLAGDLLMVYNAVRFTENEDLVTESFRACLVSPRLCKQVTCMGNKSLVPEMHDFLPNVAWWERPQGPEQQQQQEQSTNILAALTSLARDGYGINEGLRNLTTGYWTLPSLINHSCDANVTTLLLGCTMLVRACKDISAGDELLRSYMMVWGPYFGWRNSNARFTCQCERCSLERKLQAQLEPVSREYLNFRNSLHRTVPLPLDQALDLALRVEQIIKSRELTPDQGDWLRVIHHKAYNLALTGCAVGSGADHLLPTPPAFQKAKIRLAPGCWLETLLDSYAGIGIPLDQVDGLEVLKTEVIASCGPLDDVTMQAMLTLASPVWVSWFDPNSFKLWCNQVSESGLTPPIKGAVRVELFKKQD